MTPERWHEVKAALAAVLDCEPAERAACVDRLCGADAALRREVESLLAASDGADDFLARPAVERAGFDSEPDAPYDDGAAFAARLAEAVGERYTIERELGGGGMSRVFLATERGLGRRVVLKVLAPEIAAGLSVRRFAREIALAAQLQHANIVPLLSAGDADGLPYYTMPYVDGPSLRGRLARGGPAGAAEAVAILRDVARALAHAHAQGVVHRDVKPDNVLLAGGAALVTDFGIAKALSAARGGSGEVPAAPVVDPATLTRIGSTLGTPAYMAPEQVTGGAGVGDRADVYALGCTAYELLAGRPPFRGRDAHRLAAAHLAEAPPPLRPAGGAPAWLVDLVMRCLAKDPAERPSAAEIVRALDGGGAGAAPRRRGGRRPARARLAVAGVALLALAGAAAALAWRRAARPDARAAGPPSAAAAAASGARGIAVLYLDDLSEGHRLGHLANGLTEDVIDALSQVHGLRVAAPNAVRPYRASPAPLDSVGRALGVGLLVAGSVAESGERLRVTVRLMEAATGEQRWVRTFEQPRRSVLALRDSVVSQVLPVLRERLGREIRPRELRAETRSAEAWELVKRAESADEEGITLLRANDARSAAALLRRADSLYGRAEAADARWVVPVLGRSRVARNMAQVEGVWTLANPWMRTALDHADRAIRLDPGSADAWALRGELRYRASVFTPAAAESLSALAESDLRRALERRDDLARARYWLGWLYHRRARFADAERELRRAYETDAFLTEVRSVVSMLFEVSLELERYGDAAEWCRTGRGRFRDDPRFANCELTLLGWSGGGAGDAGRAWGQLREIERRDAAGLTRDWWGYRRVMVAAVLARSGDVDSARAVVARAAREYRAHSSQFADPLTEAYVRVLLGERARALALLRAHLAAAPGSAPWVARTPRFQPLHADAEFRRLVGLDGGG